jgi:hypothetical protein
MSPSWHCSGALGTFWEKQKTYREAAINGKGNIVKSAREAPAITL